MDASKDVEQKLKPLLEFLKQELAAVRTNRPSAKLVENIRVDYAGQQFLVKQLGSISIIPPREIDISAWDKNAVSSIAKAVETSGAGLTANIDGNIIRINLPVLTDERRQELIKLVKRTAEEVRIKIRAIRDESNKKIEQTFKAKTISEDQKFKSKKQIQDAVDRANKEIELLLLNKIKEISE